MEKLKYLHLVGGKGRPMPAMVIENPTSEESYAKLGILNNAIMVDSDLPAERFIGDLYRNLPTPSLLNDFLRSLAMRRQANINPKARMIETFLGSAGAGKTFQAELLGRLVAQKGAVLVDCGGKNLRELLFETLVDNEKAKDLFAKIDDLLQQYNETQDDALAPSIEILKNGLGDAFSQSETGRVGIDWKKASHDGILQSKAAKKALDFVCKAYNLKKIDTSVLGLKTQEGPLIRAWREGRPIILDEYNKSKEGTGAALQVLLQVFTGEKSQHTVQGEGLSFTFKREDKKPAFFVTVTGNTTADGGSTHGLEQSAYSRLSPKFVNDPTLYDWQHRICQSLTGVPLSTLYLSQKERWDWRFGQALRKGNPDPFAKLCKQIRLAGLSEDEKECVPSWQLTLIEHWPEVIKASEQMAQFYLAWSNAINPNSSASNDYLHEVDDEYAKMLGMNLRKMIEHINTAVQPLVMGTTADVNDWDLDAPLEQMRAFHSQSAQFNVLSGLGTRLMMTIIENVNNSTFANDPNPAMRKSDLRNYLYTVMEENGIIPMHKKGAHRGGIQTLEELLNIRSDEERQNANDMDVYAMICEGLRERYPTLANVPNEQLIAPKALELAMMENSTDTEDRIIMVNVDDIVAFSQTPFSSFKVQESQPNDVARISFMQVVDSLILPTGQQAIEQMSKSRIGWKMNEQLNILGIDLGDTQEENALEDGNEDVTINALETMDGDIVFAYNFNTKEALMIGPFALATEFKEALRKQHIDYYSVADDAQIINNALALLADDKLQSLIEEAENKFMANGQTLPEIVKHKVYPTISLQPAGRQYE